MIKVSIITSLYDGEKYLNGFFENLSQISNIKETELLIIHNSPSITELSIIENWKLEIPHFEHIVVEREGLYRSWNRGIAAASGDYVAMWSVDDRRVPDSLEKQAQLLDENNDCMIVSGHYYKVFNYGDIKGYLKKDNVKYSRLNSIPKFNNGCFLMWRKKIHSEIGYFDEQFKISGDREFWYRVTKNYKAMTCERLLGYYLRDSNEGISKGKRDKGNIENQIIKFRHFNLYIVNIYKYLMNKNIDYKILQYNGKKFEKYKFHPLFLVKVIPSFFLFWVPDLVRLLIKFKYMVAEKLTYK